MITRRQCLFWISFFGVVISIVAGCRQSDVNFPTATKGGDELAAPLGDFIMGQPEVSEWGVQYERGYSYAMVNIPVSGAIKVEYSVLRGWSGDIFLHTTEAVKLEIGLKTVDNSVDVLDSVCVTYEEGAPFETVPHSATSDIHRNGSWIHYQRRTEANSEFWPWWPRDSEFSFSGETKTTCVFLDGHATGATVTGPFPKLPSVGAVPIPSPSSTPTPIPTPAPLPTMTFIVSGAEAELQNLFISEAQAPNAMNASVFYDGATWNVQDTGSSVQVAPIASSTTTLNFYSQSGAPLTGIYTLVVSNDENDWTSGNCPVAQLSSITISVNTHTANKTYTCTNWTCAPEERVELEVEFPSGTITPTASSSILCN